MNPNYLVGAAAFALMSGGIGLSRAPSDEELAQMERDRVAAIAAKRAASPDVARAEAKRARKAAKLAATAIRNRTQEPS